MASQSQLVVRKPRTRVLLVENHPILRQGLAQLINQELDMTVCGEAEDAAKAFEAFRTLQPDVAVVDISLKGADGIELIKNVKVRFPVVPILVFSMHNESFYAERAVRAGALGYVMKEEAVDRVLLAIRRVLAGEIFLSDKMKARMLHRLAHGRAKGLVSAMENLTDRELEVFRLIGQGMSTRQIAAGLHLSVRTVECYREYIKGKLNLKSAPELVQHAFHWVRCETAA